MNVQRFTVKGRLPGQNEIIKAAKIGRRGGPYSSEKKKLTKSVAWMAIGANLTPVEGRCSIRFLWHEPNKRRDYDNIRAGAKYILDGLVEAGIIQDDGWRCVTGLDDRFFKDKEDPRVVVEIREEPTLRNGHEFLADQLSTIGDCALDQEMPDEALFIWAMALLMHYKEKAPDSYKAIARAARMQLLMALKRYPDMLEDDHRGWRGWKKVGEFG